MSMATRTLWPRMIALQWPGHVGTWQSPIRWSLIRGTIALGRALGKRLNEVFDVNSLQKLVLHLIFIRIRFIILKEYIYNF